MQPDQLCEETPGMWRVQVAAVQLQRELFKQLGPVLLKPRDARAPQERDPLSCARRAVHVFAMQ